MALWETGQRVPAGVPAVEYAGLLARLATMPPARSLPGTGGLLLIGDQLPPYDDDEPSAPPYRGSVKDAELVVLTEIRAACKNGSARRTRLAAGATLKEIGDACGASLKTVASWETGQRVPGGPRALEYGKLLARLAA